MLKLNFMPPIVFEILKFQNPAILLAGSIFAYNLRIRFFQRYGFNRVTKVIMVHDLNPNYLHIN